MSGEQRAPRRVRVTRSTPYGALTPRRTEAEARVAETVTAAPHDPVGDLYDAELRRRMLRLALRTLVAIGVPLFSLPLLFALLPAIAGPGPAGVRLPWLVLAVVVYPLLWLAALRYVGGAQRRESDHLDDVEHREDSGHREEPGRPRDLP